MFDCGFCCLVLFLLLPFDLFLLVDDVDGFESIVAVVEAAVAVDDGLDAFCVFLLRFTMNSADDDDID